jgi:hypothetical protein
MSALMHDAVAGACDLCGHSMEIMAKYGNEQRNLPKSLALHTGITSSVKSGRKRLLQIPAARSPRPV